MSHIHGRLFLVLVAALLLTVGVLAFSSARAGRGANTKKEASRKPDVSATAVASPSSAKERIEGEVIRITPNGFEPAQITRPSGTFAVVVANESGLRVMTLLLTRDVGRPLLNVVVPRKQRNWSDTLHLSPGTYTLMELTHPTWRCQFIIQ